jgi:hypothetical protein
MFIEMAAGLLLPPPRDMIREEVIGKELRAAGRFDR